MIPPLFSNNSFGETSRDREPKGFDSLGEVSEALKQDGAVTRDYSFPRTPLLQPCDFMMCLVYVFGVVLPTLLAGLVLLPFVIIIKIIGVEKRK